MDSPLSPVVANIFMKAFEYEALANYPLKSKCFFRYVDNTLFGHNVENN